MLVQTHFPDKLTATRYDRFLASGWFRGSSMMYKMDMLCMDSELHSVVNIRLPIENYTLKKRHRKLMRQNSERLRVVIGYARIDRAREELYSLQKNKFKGFVHDSLEEVLYQGLMSALFDTREVAVYDGEELIAISYFDVGETSIASLLCLHHPGYKQYSLGIYTMLQEIQWAIGRGKKWYYPGYVLDRPSSFDYKLSLGAVQWYNDNRRWSNWISYASKKTKAHRLRSRINELSEYLHEQGIKFETRLYPFFAVGYVKNISEPLLKHPLFVEYEIPETGEWRIATYDLVEEKYIALEVEPSAMMKSMVALQPSVDYLTNRVYQMNLLKVVRQGEFQIFQHNAAAEGQLV